MVLSELSRGLRAMRCAVKSTYVAVGVARLAGVQLLHIFGGKAGEPG